jgi:putative PIN family toxin of toxin-antitoxin system
MRVCLDTNVLVQLFGRNAVARPIRDALLTGQIEWAVSNEILLEYEEAITMLSGPARWEQIERFLAALFQLHGTVLFTEPHFRFAVITSDPDDNKFSDCAIAAAADYLITLDRHFDVLAASGYKPQPLTPEEFIRRHL